MVNEYFYRGRVHNKTAFYRLFHKKSYVFLQLERNDNLIFLVHLICNKMPYFSILNSKYILIGKIIHNVPINRDNSIDITANILDLFQLLKDNDKKIIKIGYLRKGTHKVSDRIK